MRDLTDAMRAQAHEFSNRMHTVSGLLELGHDDDAIGFVRARRTPTPSPARCSGERVGDPDVAALLLAKAAVAAERGVALRLTGTRVSDELVDARAVLTVLGNLLDNAIDAAPEGTSRAVGRGRPAARPATPCGSAWRLGAGVAPDDASGVRAGLDHEAVGRVGARGVGLSLVRRLAERRGGAVSVPTAPGGGALFE